MAVDGTYEVTIKTPMGDQNATLKLKTEGDTLTGTLESAMTGVAEITEGKVEGNELTWTQNARTPVGALTLHITATVVGVKISGRADSPFGPAQFEGSRQ